MLFSIALSQRRISAILSILLILVAIPKPSIAETNFAKSCFFPIVFEMPGVNYYSNASGHGDTVDPLLWEQHRQAMLPLEQFMLSASNVLDRPISWTSAPKVSAACIRETLGIWANAGAFLLPPKNSGGRVGRVMWATGLNILAGKLAYRGLPVDDSVKRWLRLVTLAAINDYEHYRFHGYYNNVNAWTGTAAATFLAISQPPSKLDLPIRAFEQTAWLDSLKGIETSGPNQGLIPSELTRGRNSLAYSLFYYNAILVHREARRSLGISDTREDWTALRSFATRFGVLYCDSAAQFFKAAGSPLTIAEEATVKANLATYAFRISSSLMEGTLKGDMFNRCQAEPVSSGYIETRFGGDSRYIKAALRK